MHELISIEKSKLRPITAALAVLAAANWANTTRQYFFELNHSVELISDATVTECASWSVLDSAIYKLENRRTQVSPTGEILIAPPELTWLPVCRNILKLPQSASAGDVNQAIESRIAEFKATGSNDGMKEAKEILGIKEPIQTKAILRRLHFLDQSVNELNNNHRYGQNHGMIYRISHFKLLNEMQAKAIARAKLIDDLTFGLL
jgi:hypothetical protein